MKKSILAVLVVLSLFFSAALQAVEVKFKVSASTNLNAGGGAEMPDFFTAVRNYNGVTDKEIMVIKRRGVAEEQIPVVMFIAARANVRPEVIVNLRRNGKSWSEIALNFGLGPDTFYVPVDGPVYGRIYGRLYSYYNRPWRQWRDIRLSDDDVVNFVNLRFMCDHYGYRPDEVIRMREGGQSFYVINRNFYTDKARLGYGWRDRNNTWHDRDRNWKPVDKTWRERQNYWKNNDNRWHGSYDAKWQERMKEQNYRDNQRWHGKYKEQDFRDDRREVRDDRREFRDDKREYRDDKREFRDDRKEFRDDKREYRDDRKEMRDDRKDFRDDKRDGRNGNNGRGNKPGQAEPTVAPTAVPTVVPTAVPAQDDGRGHGRDKGDRQGHDNGKGNDFQNNGRGNRK